MPVGWSIVGCWKVRTTSLPLGPGGACKSSAYTAGSSLVTGLGLGLGLGLGIGLGLGLGLGLGSGSGLGQQPVEGAYEEQRAVHVPD
eukprot:scaffold9072_cov62-Phaeocystis_antarctica.AAC.2